jgi:hypothetical protein
MAMSPLVLALLSTAMLGSAADKTAPQAACEDYCSATAAGKPIPWRSALPKDPEVQCQCAGPNNNYAAFSAVSVKLRKISQNPWGTRDAGALNAVAVKPGGDPAAISFNPPPQLAWTEVPVAKAAVQPAPQSDRLLSIIDWDKAKQLAQTAWERAKSFSGYCYRFVKDALDTVLPAGWRNEVGQGSAYQFATSLNSDPKLFDKLKLRKVDFNALPDGVLPIGAIIVYDRGMCGLDPEHGHIEVVVSQEPLKACSDGCMDITKRLSCIKDSPQGKVNIYVPARTPAS